MLKATKTQQAVVLLSLVTSSLITIRENNFIEDENLKVVNDLGIIRMWEIIKEYPSEGKEDGKITQAIHTRIAQMINKPKSWFTAETVVYLGHRICGDLLMELCNPAKRKMVQDANEIISRLNNYYDPEGEDISTHKEVDEILEVVYKELGFTIEHRYLKHYRKLQRRLKHHGAAC